MTAIEDMRAEHRDALLQLFNEWGRATRTPVGRSEGTYGQLADMLLEAGWRPAFDGDVEIFEDIIGGFRWRAVAENKQPVAGPQEGYVHREHAELMAARVTGVYPT